jgi:uncharacterized protein (DUF169 family)
MEEAASLTDVLELDREIVAVTFTNDEVTATGKKMWICRALKQAAAGESFVIDRETSGCGGGSWHCGFSEPPTGPAARALQHFLTRGEKLTHSIVSFQRMVGLTAPPPTGLSERLIIEPAKGASRRPDMFVFVCNPEQACRLVWLDIYWDGIPPAVELAGSLCHSAISYPAVTGRTNLTLGDWTARRMQKFESDVVFLTVPYERVGNLLAAVPESSAGTAPVEMPGGGRLTGDIP